MKLCMIVDDSSVIRKISRGIMESLGYEVVEAEDGFIALELFSEDPADLILLDINMPNMNGMECLPKLRAMKDGEIPTIICCTSENGLKSIEGAIFAGADEYVMKPFDEPIIKGKLEQLGIA